MWFKRKEKVYPKALDICEGLIALSNPDTKYGINRRKLPSLLYYSEAIHLSLFNESLFDDIIKPTMDGVIVATAYYTYKRASFQPHPVGRNKFHTEFFPSRDVILDEKEKTAIELCWKLYGDKSEIYLRNKIMNELPWRVATDGYGWWENFEPVSYTHLTLPTMAVV